jgi:hypothetical protein
MPSRRPSICVTESSDNTMHLARISRIGRSLLTLNRDREYATLKRMLVLCATDRVLDVGSGDGFWTAQLAHTPQS